MTCSDCDREFKSKSGLKSHRRAKHPAAVSNVQAVEQTIAELERMGRLETVDVAIKHALRSMAAALDADGSNAALWRQYRETLEGLTADGDDGGTAEQELIAELSGEVRDT